MIELIFGNIFDTECDMLIIPCNSMGGLSEYIESGLRKNRLPFPKRKILAGEILFVNLNGKSSLASEIAFASTYDTFTTKSSIVVIKNIMHELKKHVDEIIQNDNKSIVSVNLPALFTEAENISFLDSFDIIVKVFALCRNVKVNIHVSNERMFDQLIQVIANNEYEVAYTKMSIMQYVPPLREIYRMLADKKEATNNDSLQTKIDKKYQIFVSSTYTDLIEERKEVSQALLECGCIPAGMELFPAASKKQWDIIKSVIDDCDAYILVLAGRYGSIGTDDKGIKVGFSEMEFNYALAKGKPIIAFLHNDIGILESKKVEASDEGRKRLNRFYEKAKDERMVKYWTNKDNLKAAVFQAISYLKSEIPMVGWIRANSIVFEKRDYELQECKKKLKDAQELLNSILKKLIN